MPNKNQNMNDESVFTREQIDEAFDYAKKHGHVTIVREDNSKAIEIWIPDSSSEEEDPLDESKLIEKWDEFDRAIEELKERTKDV